MYSFESLNHLSFSSAQQSNNAINTSALLKFNNTNANVQPTFSINYSLLNNSPIGANGIDTSVCTNALHHQTQNNHQFNNNFTQNLMRFGFVLFTWCKFLFV